MAPTTPQMSVGMEDILTQTHLLHDLLFQLLDVILTSIEPSAQTPRLRRALSSVHSRTFSTSPYIPPANTPPIPAILYDRIQVQNGHNHTSSSSSSNSSNPLPVNIRNTSDPFSTSQPSLDPEDHTDENTACLISALLRTIFDVTIQSEEPAESAHPPIPLQETIQTSSAERLTWQPPSLAVSPLHSLRASVSTLGSQNDNEGSTSLLLIPNDHPTHVRRSSLQRVVSAPILASPPPYSAILADQSNADGDDLPDSGSSDQVTQNKLERRLSRQVRVLAELLAQEHKVLPLDGALRTLTDQLGCLSTILARRGPSTPSEYMAPGHRSMPTSPEAHTLVGMLMEAAPSITSDHEDLPIYTELYPSSTPNEVSRRIRAANDANGAPSTVAGSRRDFSDQRWTDKRLPRREASSAMPSSSRHRNTSGLVGDQRPNYGRRHSIAPIALSSAARQAASLRSRCSSTAGPQRQCLSTSPATSVEPLLGSPSGSRTLLADRATPSRTAFMTARRLSRMSKRYEAQRGQQPRLHEATNLGVKITRNMKRTRMENQKVEMSDRMTRDMELARLSGHLDRLNCRRLDDQQWQTPAQRLQHELEKLASGYIKFHTSETSRACTDQRFFVDEGKKRELFMKQVEGRIMRLSRLEGQDAEFRG